MEKVRYPRWPRVAAMIAVAIGVATAAIAMLR
jgi:hypothetical protein